MQNKKEYTNEELKLGTKIFYDKILPYYLEQRGSKLPEEEQKLIHKFYRQIKGEIIDYVIQGRDLNKLLSGCERVLSVAAKHQNSSRHAKKIMKIFLRSI